MARTASQTCKTLKIRDIYYTMKILFKIILTAAMAVNGGQNPDSEPAEQKRMAVVETSTCYMRLMPDYESALETQELMGTVVEIVGEKGYWREIVSPQPYKAWTTEKTLVEMTQEQIREYEDAPKYMFTGLYGHIYEEPGVKAATICDLVGGDVMRAVMRETGRYEDKPVVKGKWVKVMLPSGVTGWTYGKDVRMLGERINIRKGEASEGLIDEEKIENVIRDAMSLRGVPYFWGGMSSKGVDCSGLVRISFLMNDILLPRNASQQVLCGQEIEIPRPDIKERPEAEVKETYDRKKALKAISNLRRGDLVFFGNTQTGRITHVGLYLGDGMMIHASHLVRVNSLIPDEDNYYENAHRLIKACRLSY